MAPLFVINKDYNKRVHLFMFLYALCLCIKLLIIILPVITYLIDNRPKL